MSYRNTFFLLIIIWMQLNNALAIIIFSIFYVGREFMQVLSKRGASQTAQNTLL